MSITTEKSIFLSALEHDEPADRLAFVREACGENPSLREAVARLLAAHDRASTPLDRVPNVVIPIRQQLEAGEVVCPETLLPGESPESRSKSPALPTIAGNYKLLELIGEGGFGLVYVAEQSAPIRRRVALKLIKPGMASREVLARFEAERQAIGMMDHPNIARVFDAGSTADGQPYFVMQLVRGAAITTFCDANRLTMDQRLKLFIDVCNAVQHAHQKGVIHRDLKPSNVLVTLHDGVPVVKVIDFGVAKAIAEPLTEKTLYTRFAQMIGTPLYMSPEQAEMSGLDVDTRSDIYSLGVMLYELLTGSTPFDSNRLRTAAFDELRRIIREEEPPHPSARLTTMGEALATISANRQSESRALSHKLRGDLDWIVMKALEKDRQRRYATAGELVADVEHYLQEEPILARPPTWRYKFGKFARRNKVAITTASLVACALVLGTAVSVWQAIRATRAGDEADSLRQNAVDFADNLKRANILLDSARANADEGNYHLAYTQYTSATELQPQHYLVWSGRGSLYVRLGLWDKAAKDYAQAIKLGAPANNPSWWGIPQLCLFAGETQAYREACQTLLKQTEHLADPMFVSMAIRGCLSARQPVGDPAVLAERANLLLSAQAQPPNRMKFGGVGPPDFKRNPEDNHGPVENGERRGPGPNGDRRGPVGPRFDPWNSLGQYVAGLAEYRNGRAGRAVELLEPVVKENGQWPGRVMAYPVLAMAYHDLGRAKDASASLNEGLAAIDKSLGTMETSAQTTNWAPWFDLIECVVLSREAHEAILGQPLAKNPKFDASARRGLQELER